ncbi:MAG: M23 family metallopeptidase [Mucilaginibacter sp.]
MRRVILIAAFLLSGTAVFAQEYSHAFENFNNFNTAVLKGGATLEQAAKQFDTLQNAIRHFAMIRSQIDPEKSGWVFPLDGYNYRAIGGTNGNGYDDRGYRYLDGNRHLAHPAHDIFISDKNQDCLDDRTLQPVNVVAVANGIVIACTNDWEPTSNLRGGKYIWIYHQAGPGEPWATLTYYAHNRAIFVKPGQWVKQGQKIAEVGRNGYNAYKKRSPTHLHFSAFHLINGLPVPYNCYLKLKNVSKS